MSSSPEEMIQNILSDPSAMEKIGSLLSGLSGDEGREKKEDEIDMAAGILLEKKTGDEVAVGDLLCTVYGNNREKVEAGAREAHKAYSIGSEKPEKRELIKEVID